MNTPIPNQEHAWGYRILISVLRPIEIYWPYNKLDK